MKKYIIVSLSTSDLFSIFGFGEMGGAINSLKPVDTRLVCSMLPNFSSMSMFFKTPRSKKEKRPFSNTAGMALRTDVGDFCYHHALMLPPGKDLYLKVYSCPPIVMEEFFAEESLYALEGADVVFDSTVWDPKVSALAFTSESFNQFKGDERYNFSRHFSFKRTFSGSDFCVVEFANRGGTVYWGFEIEEDFDLSKLQILITPILGTPSVALVTYDWKVSDYEDFRINDKTLKFYEGARKLHLFRNEKIIFSADVNPANPRELLPLSLPKVPVPDCLKEFPTRTFAPKWGLAETIVWGILTVLTCGLGLPVALLVYFSMKSGKDGLLVDPPNNRITFGVISVSITDLERVTKKAYGFVLEGAFGTRCLEVPKSVRSDAEAFINELIKAKGEGGKN